MITRDFLREGWLYKTGPRAGDAFRRRWFTLDNRQLMYYEDPMVRSVTFSDDNKARARETEFVMGVPTVQIIPQTMSLVSWFVDDILFNNVQQTLSQFVRPFGRRTFWSYAANLSA